MGLDIIAAANAVLLREIIKKYRFPKWRGFCRRAVNAVGNKNSFKTHVTFDTHIILFYEVGIYDVGYEKAGQKPEAK